jgi:hypothetical protein
MRKRDNKRPRGAPKKKERIDPNGLRPDQNIWLRDEGNIRGLPAARIHREAVDWYITAKETKRATVEASKMFDNTFKDSKEVMQEQQ